MLSRKYYRDIANIINQLTSKDHLLIDSDELHLLIDSNELVNLLSDYFRQDNSSFDKGRFTEACFNSYDRKLIRRR